MAGEGRNQLRVGLLGAGYIAPFHAEAVRRSRVGELACVCDRSLERAKTLADAYRIPEAYDSLDTMLAKARLDAVHVLLPAEWHGPAAASLIEHGVAAFLEKPMAQDAGTCQEIAELAAKRGVFVGVSHNFLFSEPYERLTRALADGFLGPLKHVEIHWAKELPFVTYGPFDSWLLSEPGHVMLEVAPHSLAHLLHLAGVPEEMQVQVGRRVTLPTGKLFYNQWSVMGYAGNVSFSLFFDFGPGSARHGIRILGAAGSAEVDFEANTFALQRHSGLGVDFERYKTARVKARQLTKQACGNLLKYVMTTLKIGEGGKPYADSIARAAGCFYGCLRDHTVDRRIEPAFAMDVMKACERIAAAAPLERLETERVALSSGVASKARVPRVLVLGGTGFIGRALVRELVAGGNPVRVLSRNAVGGQFTGIEEHVELVRGSMGSADDLERILDGVEVVYHLARSASQQWRDWVRNDVEPVRLLGEACVRNGVKRLIFTGTISSYYAGARAGTIRGGTPLDSRIERRDNYSRAKAMCEYELMALHRQKHLPLVIFRPGVVIGRGGPLFHWGVAMWPDQTVCRYWGRGRNALPFVLVDDVARALALGRDASGLEGQALNLVGAPLLSAHDYVAEVELALGMRIDAASKGLITYYLQDMLKWGVKCLVRHPERRLPSYREWESRSLMAVFDHTEACEKLGWSPVSTREELVERGIREPAREYLKSMGE